MIWKLITALGGLAFVVVMFYFPFMMMGLSEGAELPQAAMVVLGACLYLGFLKTVFDD